MSYPVTESDAERQKRSEAIQRFVRYYQMLAASGTQRWERQWLFSAAAVIESPPDPRLGTNLSFDPGIGNINADTTLCRLVLQLRDALLETGVERRFLQCIAQDPGQVEGLCEDPISYAAATELIGVTRGTLLRWRKRSSDDPFRGLHAGLPARVLFASQRRFLEWCGAGGPTSLPDTGSASHV